MPRPYIPQENTPRPYTSASDVIMANQNQETPQSKIKSAFSDVVDTSKPSDIITGPAKGFGETAVDTANLISKGLQKVGVPEGTFFTPTQEKIAKTKEKLQAKSPLEKVTKGAEQFGEFFLPGSLGLKAEKGANLLTKVGTEALSTGAVNAAQTGTTEGAVEGGVVGAVSPVLGKTLSFMTKGITKNLAGALAKGTNILDNVLDNPKAALEGLNMPAEQVFNKDVGLIKNAVTNTYKQAKEAYSHGLTKLDEMIPSVDKSKATPLIEAALDKYGVKLNGSIVDVSEAPLSEAEKTVVQKAVDILATTKANTPSEVDALAQKIGKLERTGADAAQVNGIIRGFKTALRQSIVESAPQEIKDVAENIASNYAKSMDKLDLYQKLFKVSKDPYLTEVEKANATQKLKNLFSGEKPVEEQTLKELGLGDILARQAGRVSGAEDISRAQTSLADLLKTAINVVVTPKTVTSIAAHLKMGTDAVSEILHKSKTVGDFIDSLPKNAQIGVLHLLRGQEDEQ